jgi:hypothetical protein
MAEVTVAENPLPSGVTPGTDLEWVGTPGRNPFSFVSAFLFQLDQHAGGFFSRRLPIGVPKCYLREISLVSEAAV